MFGGQHRADEVTRAERVGWTWMKKSTTPANHLPRENARLRKCIGVYEETEN